MENLKSTDKQDKIPELLEKQIRKLQAQQAQTEANAIAKLKLIRDTLSASGINTTMAIINAEINAEGELAILRDKARSLHPAVCKKLDRALDGGEIHSRSWEVGYCLVIGIKPRHIACLLPLCPSTIYNYASTLKKQGFLT